MREWQAVPCFLWATRPYERRTKTLALSRACTRQSLAECGVAVEAPAAAMASSSSESGSGSRKRHKARKEHKHKHKKSSKEEHKHKEHKHKHKHKSHKRSRSRSRSRSPDARAAAAAQRFLEQQQRAAAAGGAVALAPQHAPPAPPHGLSGARHAAAALPVASRADATAPTAPAPHAAAEAAAFEAQTREDARAASKAEAKKQRRDAKERLDELCPKATGREAKVEARFARREEARARDVSPDVVVTGGGDVLGGSDSFAAALARQKRQQEAKQQRMVRRTQVLVIRACAEALAHRTAPSGAEASGAERKAGGAQRQGGGHHGGVSGAAGGRGRHPDSEARVTQRYLAICTNLKLRCKLATRGRRQAATLRERRCRRTRMSCAHGSLMMCSEMKAVQRASAFRLRRRNKATSKQRTLEAFEASFQRVIDHHAVEKAGHVPLRHLRARVRQADSNLRARPARQPPG